MVDLLKDRLLLKHQNVQNFSKGGMRTVLTLCFTELLDTLVEMKVTRMAPKLNMAVSGELYGDSRYATWVVHATPQLHVRSHLCLWRLPTDTGNNIAAFPHQFAPVVKDCYDQNLVQGGAPQVVRALGHLAESLLLSLRTKPLCSGHGHPGLRPPQWLLRGLTGDLLELGDGVNLGIPKWEG